MHQPKSSSPTPLPRQPILMYFSILLFFCLCFWPALRAAYVYHDEVMLLTDHPGNWAAHPLYHFFVFAGRILGGMYMTLCAWTADSVADLNLLRFLTVLQLAWGATILARLIHPYQKNIDALLISVLVFSLPPFQVTVSWLGIAYLAPAILLSLTAARLTLKTEITRPFWKILTTKPSMTATTLLVAAHFFYPSAATFYWVPAAYLLLFVPAKSRPSLRNFFVIGLSAIVVYGLIIKLSKYFLPHLASSIYNPQQITQNWTGQLQWFWQEPLFNAVNLWWIYPLAGRGKIILGFLLLSYLLALGRREKPAAIDNRLQNIATDIAMGAAFVLLSFLPNLVAAGQASFYRCLTALEAMILLALLASLQNWLSWLAAPAARRTFTMILIAAAVLAAYQSHTNIRQGRAVPSQREIHFLKQKIQTAISQRQKEIHVILPTKNMARTRYDEFGSLTSHYFFDMNALSAILFKEIMRDTGLNTKRLLIVPAEGWRGTVQGLFYEASAPQDLFAYELKMSYSLPQDNIVPAASVVINMDDLIY